MDPESIKIEWGKLSKERQDLYVTVLWEDGYSERAIAVFLGATKGRIVRRRHDLKLKSEGRPPTKSTVDGGRFRDLLELHALREAEARAKEASTPEAPPPPPTCQWPLPSSTGKPILCGKPVVPGHRLCEEHMAIVWPKKS